MISEYEVMLQVRSPYVVSLHQATKTKKNYYFFFEYYNGGDLRKLFNAKGKHLSEKIVQVVSTQICKGLCYLSSLNIIHWDLKLDNIFIHFPSQPADQQVSDEFLKNWDPDNDPIECAIGDLGFAKKMDDFSTKSYCGTPLNMAP